LNLRLPECEILIPNNPVKAHIRSSEFFKIISDMEIGAEHGMWTWERYRRWMEKRSQWHVPDQTDEAPDSEAEAGDPSSLTKPASPTAAPVSAPVEPQPASKLSMTGPGSRLEIEPVEGGLAELARRLAK
jgi:hypothetical protein